MKSFFMTKSLRERALLLAFNAGAGIYLLLIGRLMQKATPAAMHHRARLQDDGKWVVLMVLFSQPDEANAYARMEDLVFEEQTEHALH